MRKLFFIAMNILEMSLEYIFFSMQSLSNIMKYTNYGGRRDRDCMVVG